VEKIAIPVIGINKVVTSDREAEMDFVPVELDVDRYHNEGIAYLNAREYEKAVEMFKKEIALRNAEKMHEHGLKDD